MFQIAHRQELIGLILVGVVALLGIYWLLRVTLGGAASLGKFGLPPKPYKRILLPAAPDMAYTDEGINLACRLAGSPGSGGGAASLIRGMEPDYAFPPCVSPS